MNTPDLAATIASGVAEARAAMAEATRHIQSLREDNAQLRNRVEDLMRERDRCRARCETLQLQLMAQGRST